MINEDKNRENVIEFLSGEHYCCVTFTNRLHINRLKKIYEQHPEDFKYLYENTDGSVCAKIPLKWIKVNPVKRTAKELSEEEKEKLRERMAQARQKRMKNLKQKGTKV